MKEIVPPTPEQQKLVEANHNLIYHILDLNKCSIEDYYGAAAIGLCKAAIDYDGRNGTPFANFACLSITHEVWKEINRRETKKRKEKTVSLDFPITPTLTLGETLQDLETPETIMFAQDILSEICRLRGKNGKLLMLKLSGYSMKEISQITGLKISSVGDAIFRAKRRLIATGVI